MEKQRVEAKLNEDLLEQLMSKADFEVPEGLVNQEVESMVARLEQDLTRQGLTWPKTRRTLIDSGKI